MITMKNIITTCITTYSLYTFRTKLKQMFRKKHMFRKEKQYMQISSIITIYPHDKVEGKSSE